MVLSHSQMAESYPVRYWISWEVSSVAMAASNWNADSNCSPKTSYLLILHYSHCILKALEAVPQRDVLVVLVSDSEVEWFQK